MKSLGEGGQGLALEFSSLGSQPAFHIPILRTHIPHSTARHPELGPYAALSLCHPLLNTRPSKELRSLLQPYLDSECAPFHFGAS